MPGSEKLLRRNAQKLGGRGGLDGYRLDLTISIPGEDLRG